MARKKTGTRKRLAKRTKNGEDTTLKRKRGTVGGDVGVKRGIIDMECKEGCGRLVSVDANSRSVTCGRCMQKLVAPPVQTRSLTEEERKIMAEKKAAKRDAKARGEDVADGRGRQSEFAGMYLYRTVTHNPRRPGCRPHGFWNDTRDGTTFEAWAKVGWLSLDVRYEMEYDRVKAFAKKPKTAPKKTNNKEDFDRMKANAAAKDKPAAKKAKAPAKKAKAPAKKAKAKAKAKKPADAKEDF